jgi:peptide/nickel transport system permease protein
MKPRLAVGVLLAIHLAVLFAGWLSPYDPTEQHRDAALTPPSRAFLLGTDQYGRDQLSRVLHGGRVSLTAGWIATGIALSLALALGSIAGYYGGWIDELTMRAADLFLALPWLYLLIAVRALLPLTLEPRAAFLLISGLIGFLGWARPARLIRGIALSVKQRDYVQAARGFGASNVYLLMRHILPETRSVALTQAAILAPQFILAEVSLSLFGLGVPEPFATWGGMLGSFRQVALLATCWWLVAPLVVLVIVLACYRTLQLE